MTMRTYRTVLASAICLTAFASCQKDIPSTERSGDKICAKVGSVSESTKSAAITYEELSWSQVVSEDSLILQEYVSDNLSQPFITDDPGTKGTVVTTGNIATVYKKFTMEGYLGNPSDAAEELSKYGRSLVDTDQYIKDGTVDYKDGEWILTDGSETYPWLHGINYTFWSYAPSTDHAGTYSFGSAGSRGTMTITDYVNPTAAADQKDILVACNTLHYDAGDSKYVNVKFRHALADVCFDASSITDVTITKIEITGAYSKGACEVNGTDLADADVTKAFTWAPDTESAATFEMTGADDHFFMIPQTLPASAKICFTIDSDGEQKDKEVSFSATWKPGKIYKYVLKYVEDKIVVEGDVITDYLAVGTKEYDVNSNQPWKMQYSSDDGSSWVDVSAGTVYDDWVSFSSPGVSSGSVIGGESTPGTAVTATVNPASATSQFILDHAEVLRKATPKGTRNKPYDLSMYDIHGNPNASGANTANCYVINAPGWYAFPLVYGNSVQNGVENTSAYVDDTITSKNISGVTSAAPVWEDLPNWAIVPEDGCTILSPSEAAEKGLTGCSGCGYLMFHVPAENLNEGNALIAAKNGSDIQWSWHIWITDADLTPKKIKNVYANNFLSYPSWDMYLLPQCLGWVDENTKVNGYEGKNLLVRFVQVKAGALGENVERLAIRREHVDSWESTQGTGPTWQWGRKDPFIRGNGIPGGLGASAELTEVSGSPLNRIYYPSIASEADISFSIAHPTYFIYQDYGSSQRWYKGDPKRKLWDATNTGYLYGDGNNILDLLALRPTKTVYDPCPPGYQVPVSSAFDEFSKVAGAPVYDEENYWRGVNFTIDGVPIFIPVPGYRTYGIYLGREGGILGDIGTAGFFWTATEYDSQSGNMLRLVAPSFVTEDDPMVTAFAPAYECFGNSIIPMRSY